ncbi:hypothetical protein [Saliphagus sp. LR7]|uniref:hypothetical protein n=1 Tax=Saliphagus sp. LR7 TaxID=2282654 RepID=UPI000DF8045A|nr:hypothetical protein [Saliphagus sp. LR7]
MEPTQDPHEIAAELSRKTHRILAAIRNRGGEATTSEITSATNLDNSLVNYHYKGLLRAEVIEKISEGDTSQGLPREGFSYRITDRGREVLSAAQEDYDMTALEEGAVRRRFDRIEDRIGGIEDSLQARSEADDQDDRDGDLEERVASLESDFEDLVEDVGTVVERLEEVREEVGVSEL